MMSCKWLPEFYPEPDWTNYKAFEERLFEVFKALYLDYDVKFQDIIVRYRFKPYENGRPHIFYHLTCRDFQKDEDRSPESDRIIRIKWTRAFIENYICNEECCQDSEKPYYWVKEDSRSKKKRHKIFYKDFLVILEERADYFLLITGYYVQDDYYIKGLIKEYNKNK